jgi:hypothetical protein
MSNRQAIILDLTKNEVCNNEPKGGRNPSTKESLLSVVQYFQKQLLVIEEKNFDDANMQDVKLLSKIPNVAVRFLQVSNEINKIHHDDLRTPIPAMKKGRKECIKKFWLTPHAIVQMLVWMKEFKNWDNKANVISKYWD